MIAKNPDDKAEDEASRAYEDALRDIQEELGDSESAQQELEAGVADKASLEIDISRGGIAEVFPETFREAAQFATTLSAYGNRLSALPGWISEYTELAAVFLSENQFTDLPAVLRELPKLTELDMSNNPLDAVPGRLLDLAGLQILHLTGTGISELPTNLGRLRSLTELYLGGNRISELPDSVADLIGLQELNIEANSLKALPVRIGRLSSLRRLNANANQLKRLTPTVRSLQSLTHLDLSQNDITDLPSRIGELKSLEYLDLSYNNLTELPRSIGKLTSLDFLNLSGNQLETLPRELGDLRDDVTLVLEGNPLAEPLPSLLTRGVPALLTYLRSLASGSPQYEAKVLFVGEGSVGKSSLVAALRGEEFVAGRPTTHGIELGSLRLAHPRLEVDLVLNTWDFGGQEVYRITHQFFFSKRALYILVWNPREGREENSVEGWIRRIRLRVGNQARVILVATHSSERRAELDFEALRAKFPGTLVEYVRVDSLTGDGIDELKSVIAMAASALPQMGEVIDVRWEAARNDILSIRETQISRVRYERVCTDNGLEEDEAETLADLLHDLGHVIHYGDDAGLRDLVVLQPEWLTKAIGYVLEDEETRAQGGLLAHERLVEIWTTTLPEGYERRFYAYFLRLMEKFDVSFRNPDGQSSLVAQVVPYERPRGVINRRPEFDGDVKYLRVICRMTEEAPGLIPWLTVRNSRFSTGLQWRKGVQLRHPRYKTQALIELVSECDLALIVVGPTPDFFYHVLRDSIEELISQRWKGLGYEFLVPCRLRDGDEPCSGLFSQRVLERFRQRSELTIVCQQCAEWNRVDELLTGFGRVVQPVDVLLSSIERTQRAIVGHQALTLSAVKRMERLGSTTAQGVRVALKILTVEVPDCPRLFTLVPNDRTKVISAISSHDSLRLTLWCEEVGSEHPVSAAQYDFKPPKEWVEKAGPYLKVVARLLKLVPLGTALYGSVLSPEDYSRARADLELTKALAGIFPDVSDGSRRDRGQGLTAAEGAALRAFRTLLFSLDQQQLFGGMRQVRTISGDIAWVCSDHHDRYDPGLPEAL